MRKYFTEKSELVHGDCFFQNYKTLKIFEILKRKNENEAPFKIMIRLDEAYSNVRVSLDTFKRIEFILMNRNKETATDSNLVHVITQLVSPNQNDYEGDEDFKAVLGEYINKFCWSENKKNFNNIFFF